MMKKLILTVITIALFLPIKAQYSIESNQSYQKSGKISQKDKIQQTNVLRRAANGYSGWFNQIGILDALASDPANLEVFVNLISYDSNLVQISAEGVRYFVGSHSFGTIVDPTDPDWNEMQTPITKDNIFNQHSKYTFDSLQIPYLYIRNVDSMMISGKNEKIIDTLFVQYFLKPQLSMFNFDQMSLIPDSLNVATGMAHNYARMDTVLLNETNSTEKTGSNTYALSNMRLFVGMANNLPDGINGKHTATYKGLTNPWVGQDDYRKSCIGFNMFFKSMKPTVNGDTMNANDGSIVHNKHNYFGYRFVRDANPREAQVENYEHFNGSFEGRKDIRYGQVHVSSRPQKYRYKHFLPSRAYFEKQYHYANFKLTTQHNSDVKELNINGYGVDQIYPNPTNGIAFLNISLKKASNVKLQIFNISGQNVLSNNTFATSGSSIINFNTKNLAKGIYLATIKVENNTFTRKFIVE